MQRIEKRIARANANYQKTRRTENGSRTKAAAIQLVWNEHLVRDRPVRKRSSHKLVTLLFVSRHLPSVSGAQYHPKRRKPKSNKPKNGQPKEKPILVHCRFCQLIIRAPSTAAVRWSRCVTGTAVSMSCDCAPIIWALAPKT